MADNYLERQYEEYLKKKALWERRREKFPTPTKRKEL